MTAVEEIAVAIAKLMASRRASTPAPWVVGFRGDVETVAAFDPNRFDVRPETIARTDLHSMDGELIAILHRTIDAQLAILELTRQFASLTPNRFTDVGLDLARAINAGNASAPSSSKEIQ